MVTPSRAARVCSFISWVSDPANLISTGRTRVQMSCSTGTRRADKRPTRCSLGAHLHSTRFSNMARRLVTSVFSSLILNALQRGARTHQNFGLSCFRTSTRENPADRGVPHSSA